jgi:excisionase family DNA binding protein
MNESGRKLVGWKEVAEYLGTSPRTVQRWEREKGLPVHRVPGSNGHSVLADPEELDRWLRSDVQSRLESTLARSTPAIGQQPGRPAAHGTLPHFEGHGDTEQAQARRSPALRTVAIAASALILLLGVGLILARSAGSGATAVSRLVQTARPAIASVTAIQPAADQVIVIKGHGLGVHTYYANGDTPFLAIRDKTAGWAAGRIIPENWDEVTLNVAHWTDSEIDVTGFAGAYGQHWWKLNPGDHIEVAVWNPQTQSGPATYELTVSSPQLAQK